MPNTNTEMKITPLTYAHGPLRLKGLVVRPAPAREAGRDGRPAPAGPETMRAERQNAPPGTMRPEGRTESPATQPDALPAVLLIHEYTGLGDYLLPHARALTGAGYLVLCHDMYGDGRQAADRAEASRLSRPMRDDRLLMRARARAGYEALRALPDADPTRLFALGFSFGGGAVLELARDGADLRAAASFYGYPDTTHPANPGDVRARILVLHGALDKVATMDQLAQLEGEMDLAGADCRVVVYPGAGHAFSNLHAAPDPASGSFPSAATHADAWAETLAFFRASSP